MEGVSDGWIRYISLLVLPSGDSVIAIVHNSGWHCSHRKHVKTLPLRKEDILPQWRLPPRFPSGEK